MAEPDRRPGEVDLLFAEARRLHQAGFLGDAEGLYRRVLAMDARHAGSVHLLGVIAVQAGRPDLAIAIIGEAIALDGTVASFHSDLGGALQQAGRLAAAAASLRRALDLDPGHAVACNNLGNVLRQQGRIDAAAECYRRAILLRPDFAEPQCSLGTLLHHQGDLDEAAACLGRAIALRPDLVEAHTGLGNVLRDLGRLEESEACLRRAVGLRPDFAEAHTGLGNVLRAQGRMAEAVACHTRAVALRPDAPEAHNCLGVALQGERRLDAAVASYGPALALDPDYAQAEANLGVARQEQGDPEAAIRCHRRALALKPDDAETHNNLACALLLNGELEEGWQHYEWRWQTAQMRRTRRGFAQPQWRGEPADGRILLVHAEQGLGDSLQFCRYAPLAAARGWRVVVEVQPPLVRLLRSLPGIDRVVGRGDPLPDFDFHCPMLSLPLAVNTSLATIPAAESTLQADPAAVAAWRDRLGEASGELARIGLAWAGNPRRDSPLKTAVDRRRSVAPETLAPLLEVPGLRFFSLQKDGPPPPAGLPLTDVMAGMADFADTAALVANLDLVITVDTAVAHLAASLGKPVWLLNRFDSCWRWLLHRPDSPWYPSLRLFRQPSPGDWGAVVEAVKAELRRFRPAAP